MQTTRGMRAHAGVSLLQLLVGLTGMAVAVRRGYVFDTPVLRGSPDHVVRDAVLWGTPFSAPPLMLASQAVFVARAATGDTRASRGLQLLGAVMVPGHLIERLGRRRLRPAGWDPVETPIVMAGLSLAAVMALGPRRPAAG